MLISLNVIYICSNVDLDQQVRFWYLSYMHCLIIHADAVVLAFQILACVIIYVFILFV